MRNITLAAAKANLSKLIERAAAGETVRITRCGKPVTEVKTPRNQIDHLALGALTEAGCDHPTVLDALSEPLVPAEACWMVETLAGAEPGTLLRHHL